MTEPLSERAQKGNFTKATGGKNDTAHLYFNTTQELMETFAFRVYGDTQEIIVYDDDRGYYVPENGLLREQIYLRLGVEATTKAQREIKNFITAARLFDREEDCGAIKEKKDDEGRTVGSLLHVRNGWLDLMTGELLPHTREIVSTAVLPVSYDKNAIAREFIKVMREALTRDYAMLFLKTIGNLLIPDCRYEKITYLVGKGHNRKSTLMKAIVHGVLGRGNYCCVPPQDFAKDKFAAADLDGKLANVVFDLEAHRITDTGVLKTVISGDPIRVQRKFGQAHQIRPVAKHIMIANDIPESDDKSHAYWRRQNVIPFYTTFEEDKTIEARLSTDEERSGILNLMICGMRKLLHDGFNEIDIAKVRTLYEYNGITARDFLEHECFVNVEDHSIENKASSSALQVAYIAFETRKRGRPVDNMEKDYLTRVLGEELKKIGVKKEKKGPRGSQKYYYIGLRLKSEALSGQATL
jgi:P4 family phage/plasmid primase-like protien